MGKSKKEKPSLRDYFSLESELFDSKIYYPSEWIIGDSFSIDENNDFDKVKNSMLYLNALKVDGKNAFYEFLQKRFVPLVKHVYAGNYDLVGKEIYPYITMQADDNRRFIGFGKSPILSDLLLNSYSFMLRREGLDITEDEDADEKALQILRDALREDRKILREVKTNPDSEYQKCFGIIKPDGSPVSPQRRTVLLEELSEKAMARNAGAKYLGELLGHEIDYNEFMECFNYDKLCLLLAVSAYEDTNDHLEKVHEASGSLMYLFAYVNMVKEFRKHYPNYDAHIDMYTTDKKGNKKLVDFHINDLMKKFDVIMEEHPEFKDNEVELTSLFKRFNISKEYIDSLSPVEYTMFVQELLERNKKLDLIAVNWEILPEKEGVKEESSTPRGRRSSEDAFDYSSQSELFNDYIVSLPALLRLQGKNKFDGYTAYVFSNSKVILEKPKGSKKSEYYGATYVMDLDAFFELSKLSRAEIMDGLASGEISGVSRVYHTYDASAEDPIHKYKARIERHLQDSEYTKEKIDDIYAIIENAKNKENQDGYQRVRKNED